MFKYPCVWRSKPPMLEQEQIQQCIKLTRNEWGMFQPGQWLLSATKNVWSLVGTKNLLLFKIYKGGGTLKNTLPTLVHGQTFYIVSWQPPPSRRLPLSNSPWCAEQLLDLSPGDFTSTQFMIVSNKKQMIVTVRIGICYEIVLLLYSHPFCKEKVAL